MSRPPIHVGAPTLVWVATMVRISSESSRRRTRSAPTPGRRLVPDKCSARPATDPVGIMVNASGEGTRVRRFPISVARLPVRYDDSPYYFNDKYQMMPADGYTSLVGRMLDHPSIQVQLGTLEASGGAVTVTVELLT